jgi:hypothetical protein
MAIQGSTAYLTGVRLDAMQVEEVAAVQRLAFLPTPPALLQGGGAHGLLNFSEFSSGLGTQAFPTG